MKDRLYERTEIIIGEEGVERLRKANVIVFGVGGVGSFAVEGLVRAGIGNMTIVDFDKVDDSNRNRQIPALVSNIGKNKVEVMADRIKDINPDINLKVFKEMYNEDTSDMFFEDSYDFVVDAIDMVSSKIHLIKKAKEKGIDIISSMGMGNKLDPTKIEIADIFSTQMCPLAKIVRREMKKSGIKKLDVVYSKEKPCSTGTEIEDGRVKRVNGSISFVPSVGGLVIASYIVRKIIER